MNAAEMVFFGTRVECHTRSELQAVIRYLEQHFPHWHYKRWKPQNVSPRGDFCALALGNEKSPNIVVNNATILALLPRNEKTITYTEFQRLSGIRGKYKRGGNGRAERR